MITWESLALASCMLVVLGCVVLILGDQLFGPEELKEKREEDEDDHYMGYNMEHGAAGCYYGGGQQGNNHYHLPHQQGGWNHYHYPIPTHHHPTSSSYAAAAAAAAGGGGFLPHPSQQQPYHQNPFPPALPPPHLTHQQSPPSPQVLYHPHSHNYTQRSSISSMASTNINNAATITGTAPTSIERVRRRTYGSYGGSAGGSDAMMMMSSDASTSGSSASILPRPHGTTQSSSSSVLFPSGQSHHHQQQQQQHLPRPSTTTGNIQASPRRPSGGTSTNTSIPPLQQQQGERGTAQSSYYKARINAHGRVDLIPPSTIHDQEEEEEEDQQREQQVQEEEEGRIGMLGQSHQRPLLPLSIPPPSSTRLSVEDEDDCEGHKRRESEGGRGLLQLPPPPLRSPPLQASPRPETARLKKQQSSIEPIGGGRRGEYPSITNIKQQQEAGGLSRVPRQDAITLASPAIAPPPPPVPLLQAQQQQHQQQQGRGFEKGDRRAGDKIIRAALHEGGGGNRRNDDGVSSPESKASASTVSMSNVMNSGWSSNLEIDLKELAFDIQLGQGGFGEVWRGSWRGTPVAIKVLSHHATTSTTHHQHHGGEGGAGIEGMAAIANKSALLEFQAEVSMLASLRHPNICLFLGACLKPPKRAIVTELVSRGSLWDVLRQPLPPGLGTGNIDAPWPLHLVWKVAHGTACGMNYLHRHEPAILHRDLKSANILLDDSFAVKICDFGLARLKAFTNIMTGSCGTTQWMAPEVLANSRYSESADVYSYGIVVWELLSRRCPYEGMTAVQVAIDVLGQGLRPSIPSICPKKLSELISRCWAQIPHQRPSFQVVLEALQTMISTPSASVSVIQQQQQQQQQQQKQRASGRDMGSPSAVGKGGGGYRYSTPQQQQQQQRQYEEVEDDEDDW